MEIKIFTVPMQGGEAETEEMNKFLRGNKILGVTEAAVVTSGGNWWSYSVRFLKTDNSAKSARGKVDYRKVLDANTFDIFSLLRGRRKLLAEKNAVPAYVIFTDAELAEIAKLGEGVSLADLKSVAGIGKQKVEKYGAEILNLVGE